MSEKFARKQREPHSVCTNHTDQTVCREKEQIHEGKEKLNGRIYSHAHTLGFALERTENLIHWRTTFAFAFKKQNFLAHTTCKNSCHINLQNKIQKKYRMISTEMEITSTITFKVLSMFLHKNVTTTTQFLLFVVL